MNNKYVPNENSSLDKRLGYLVEECGEVMAAVGKSIRWGLAGFNPEPDSDREVNRDWIKRELKDLKYAIELIEKTI